MPCALVWSFRPLLFTRTSGTLDLSCFQPWVLCQTNGWPIMSEAEIQKNKFWCNSHFVPLIWLAATGSSKQATQMEWAYPSAFHRAHQWRSWSLNHGPIAREGAFIEGTISLSSAFSFSLVLMEDGILQKLFCILTATSFTHEQQKASHSTNSRSIYTS